MEPKSDAALLRDYAERGVEDAFAEIVRRHTNLVYSAALRQVESPDAAAEITQNAFVALARGAQSLLSSLAPQAALGGWLCRVARNHSLNFRRDEFRRQKRERQAVTPMNSFLESSSEWEEVRPVLDEAMAELNEADYDAIVLRFLQNQDFRSVGVALGVTDDTAQKRVTRALEKLRQLLARRGIRTSAGALSGLIMANGIQAAPSGLTAAILTATTAAGASPAAALLATTKTLAMTTLQKTLVTVTVAVLAGTGVYQTHRSAQLRKQVQSLQDQQAPLLSLIEQLQRERDAATNRLADDSGLSNRQISELAKLRGEVGRLRQDSRELARLKNDRANPAGADPDIDAALRSIEAQASQLKQRLEEWPQLKIPEIALLTGKDWIDLIGRASPSGEFKLEDENDYRFAIGRVRSEAKKKFGAQLQQALRKYVGAHEGKLPSDLSQLQEYFDQPIDAAVLQRYAMLKSGKASDAGNAYLVREIAPPVDEDHDSRLAFSLGNTFEQSASAQARARGPDRSPEVVWAAMLEQAKANQGKLSRDPSVLAPYLSQPLDSAKLNRILSQIPEEVITADQLKAGLNSRPVWPPPQPPNPFD